MTGTKRFYHGYEQSAGQYCDIYNARLKSAREVLVRKSKEKWGDVKNVLLEELNETQGEVYIIGTLFKKMPRQPSILNDQEDVCTKTNFTSDEDSLILHETDENVEVVGNIDVHVHVTGIPVSLLGHQQNGGAKFYVHDICYAGPSLSVYDVPEGTKKSENNMLIISGLEFGPDASDEYLQALKKLRELVITKTAGIIIAGNSIASNVSNVKEIFPILDNYLLTLAQGGAKIYIMPGENDPTSFLLPQQPFHPRILPKSGALENVHPQTNPSLIEFEDLIILGTSGENIRAIRQHSRIEDSNTMLKNTLQWGHIAPSAPDNLGCVPFKQNDPFFLDFVPDLYFAGNQPSCGITTYTTESNQKVQVISVPRFRETLTCVTLNPTTREIEPVSLKSE